MARKHITYSNRREYCKNLRASKERIVLKRNFVDMLGGCCIDCGYKAHLAALDFDHINPKTKIAEIGTMLGSRKYTHEEISVEVMKCVIRCANCHRIKTNPTATD